MSVNESQLKQSVQQAIKNVLIDSKYNDEAISFGQAIVTHYYLQQMQAAAASGNQDGMPITSQQHLNNLTRSTSVQQHISQIGEESAPHQQVVQFDLIKQGLPELKPNFARKKGKFDEEATCVKDVFQWDDGYHESFKNIKMKELQRSPSKWQSEQRDKFRFFVDSNTAHKLEKKGNEEAQSAPIAASTGANKAGGEELEKRANVAADLNAEFNGAAALQVPQPTVEETDHHSRKVRINKDALKKRGQSAKHKVMVDPTRENYKEPTRWLADSAFTTYFGKPAFHAYGKGNVNPVVGGNIYGQYMLSHNVNPESGNNLPQYQQVYPNALQYGLRKNNGARQPELPRRPTTAAVQGSRPGEPQLKTASDYDLKRNPIMPQDGPKQVASKLGKSKAQTIKILRPVQDKRTLNGSLGLTHKAPISTHKKTATQSPKKVKKTEESNGGRDHHENEEGELLEDAFHTEDQKQVYSHVDFAIDENQDIGEADDLHQGDENVDYANQQVQHQQQQQQYVPLCGLPTGRKVDVKELDPRSYQFTPACWIQRIRPAGKVTYRSENLYNVVTQGHDEV